MVETNSTPDHKIDLSRCSEGVWLNPPFISFDLEVARWEFASRAKNQGTTNRLAGAWANPVGLGSNTYVFHADGTVTSCIGQKARGPSHLDDPGDETLRVSDHARERGGMGRRRADGACRASGASICPVSFQHLKRARCCHVLRGRWADRVWDDRGPEKGSYGRNSSRQGHVAQYAHCGRRQFSPFPTRPPNPNAPAGRGFEPAHDRRNQFV